MSQTAALHRFFLRLLLLLAVTAFSGFAASTTLVINEVLYNPSGTDAGSEWVELIARNDVTVTNYTLSDQDGHSYTFPSLSLDAGEIVVVHFGTGVDDLSGPVYHLYTGVAEAWLDNTGDDLLLSDGSGNSVDYMAYGSGAQAPPGDTSWSNTISVTYVSEGHSLGLVNDGIDQDSGSAFAEFDTPTEGEPNGSPSVSITKSGPDAISRGNTAGYEYNITVTSTGSGPLYGVSIDEDYPANFSVLSVTSVTRNGQAVSVTQSDNSDVLTFSNLPDLLKGDVFKVRLKLAASCTASIGYTTNIARVHHYGKPDLSGGVTDTTATFDTEVQKGIEKNIFQAIAVNGTAIVPTATPEVNVGDTITYQAIVQNTGDGALYDVNSSVSYGTGFSYQNNLTCTGVSCSYDSVNDEVDAHTDVLPGETTDSSYAYAFDLQVDACTGLTGTIVTTDRCDGNTPISSGPIVILKTPDIDYNLSADPISVPYDGSALGYTIGVTNSGTGDAYQFTLDTSFESSVLIVSNVAAGWSYDSGTGVFSYSGTIAAGVTENLTFDLAKPVDCANRSPSGVITFAPDYQSACGANSYAPTKYTSYSTGAVPSVGITKTLNNQYVAIGNQADFNVSISVSNAAQISGNVVVTDTIPAEFENVTYSVSAGSVSQSGNTLTWTVAAGSADGALMQVAADIINDPCLQGTTTTNTATVDATDSSGCTLTGSASTTVYINNNPENTVDQQKSASGTLEACDSSGMTLTNSYQTGTGVPGNWTGSILSDDLHGGDLCYIDGTAEYNFDADDGAGESLAGWSSVAGADVSVDGSGQLNIDLGFLKSVDESVGADENVSGNNLYVRYKVYACESKLAGSDSVSWDAITDFYISGNSGSCSTYSGHYKQHYVAAIQRASVGLGIDIPSIVEDCGISDATITVAQNTPVDYYDLNVTMPTDHYSYEGGLSVSGFGGAVPSEVNGSSDVRFIFDQTASPDALSAGGTLSFKVRKKCSTGSDISATAAYVSRSDSSATATACCGGDCGGTQRTATASDSTVFNNKGDLIIHVTPEDYPVTAKQLKWRMTVTNRGDGTAYNTVLEDILGPNFDYNSSTVGGVAASPTVTDDTPSAGQSTVSWALGDLAPSQSVVIEVVVDLNGLSCDYDDTTSDISLYWGCAGGTCQSLSGIALPNFSKPTSDAVGQTVFPENVQLCRDANITYQFKNVGESTVYNAEMIQDLLSTNMTYISGSTEVSTDGASYSAAVDPVISGTELTWQGHTSTDANYVPEAQTVDSGGNVYLRYRVHTHCNVVSDPQIDATGSFQRPCQANGTARESMPTRSRNTPYVAPNLSMNLQVRNLTTGSAWSSGNVFASPGDHIQYRFTIQNSGSVAAESLELNDTLPSNLSFVSISAQSVESGGVQSGGSPSWQLESVGAGDTDIYIIEANVDTCAGDQSNTGTLAYGCDAHDGYATCRTFSLSATHGTYGKLITQPSLNSAIELSSSSFTTCGGTLDISVTNTGAKTGSIDFIRSAIPAGWSYDGNGSGTTIGFTINGVDSAVSHTVTTEEPTFFGGDVHDPQWSSANGNIDYIDTNETVSISFNVMADGTYCDTNLSTDPNLPGSVSSSTDIQIQDACGNTYPLTKNTMITPNQPDIDITVTPVNQVAGEGDSVTLTVTLTNNGDATAYDLGTVLTLGNGLSVTAAQQGGVIDNASDPRTVAWSDGDINGGAGLAAGGTWSAQVEATVDGGSLQVYAVSEGYCQNRAGTRVCRHSYDRDDAYIVGVDNSKEISALAEPGTITNTLNAYATLGNVVVFDLKTKLSGTGTYKNFRIQDGLNSRFAFVKAAFDGEDWNNSSRTFVDINTSYGSVDGGLRAKYTVSGNTYRFWFDDPNDNSGDGEFNVTTAPQYITVRLYAEVKTTNTAGNSVRNRHYSYFEYDNGDGSYQSYENSGTYTLLRSDRPRVRFIEPELAITKSYSGWGSTYNAVTPKEVSAGETVAFTLALQNTDTTYTSPAYDVVVTDMIPYGMRLTQPSIRNIFIDTNGDGTFNGSDRNLTGGGYSVQWNASDGNWSIALENGANGDTANTNILDRDESLVLEYNAYVDDDVGVGITMQNSADATYSTLRGSPVSPEFEEQNYVTSTTTTDLTTGEANLTKASTLDGSVVADGDELVYTMQFPNPVQDVFLYGDDDDNDPQGSAEFTDTIPNGLEVRSAAVTVNPTRACQNVAGVTVPPYDVNNSCGGSVSDDRVFNVTLSTVSGSRNRKVDINFNRLYPGDSFVVTIRAKVHPTYDDGTLIEKGDVFTNVADIDVYNKPSSGSRSVTHYTSNTVTSTYSKLVTLTPDRSGQTLPGSWISYEHTVNNLMSNSDDFCFSVASGSGWTWAIFDASGNVLMDESGNTVTVLSLGGTSQEVVTAKYFVPSNTPEGTTDATTILLHPYAAGSCDTGVWYDDATDTTVIDSSRLRLTKQVRKCLKSDITNCDTFSQNNSADPCDYLEYHIAFKNIASEAYYTFHINDIIAPYTDFVTDAYDTGASAEEDVVVQKPDGSTVLIDASVNDSTVEIDLSGEIPVLEPGAEGYIRYKTRIQGDNCP